jgi:hypothetical protein
VRLDHKANVEGSMPISTRRPHTFLSDENKQLPRPIQYRTHESLYVNETGVYVQLYRVSNSTGMSNSGYHTTNITPPCPTNVSTSTELTSKIVCIDLQLLCTTSPRGSLICIRNKDFNLPLFISTGKARSSELGQILGQSLWQRLIAFPVYAGTEETLLESHLVNVQPLKEAAAMGNANSRQKLTQPFRSAAAVLLERTKMRDGLNVLLAKIKEIIGVSRWPSHEIETCHKG